MEYRIPLVTLPLLCSASSSLTFALPCPVLLCATLSVHTGSAQRAQKVDRSCVSVPPSSPLYPLAVRAVAAAVACAPSAKGTKGVKSSATATPPSGTHVSVGRVEEEYEDGYEDDSGAGQGQGQGQGQGETVGGVWMPKIGESASALSGCGVDAAPFR